VSEKDTREVRWMQNGICIVNYFSSDHVNRLIHEFARDKLQLPVVVVDNSVDRAESIKLENITKFSWTSEINLSILSNNSNLGYYFGNYTGVAYLKEKFGVKKVLIVNPDVSSENWCLLIEELGKYFVNPEDFIAGPKINNGTRFVSSPIPDMPPFLIAAYNFFYPLTYLIYKCFQRKLSSSPGNETFAVEGSCMLVDTEKFLSIYEHMNGVFLYEEERIIGTIAKQNAWRIYYVPAVEISHLHKPLSLSTQNERYYISSTNKYLDILNARKLTRKIVIASLRYRFFVKKMISSIIRLFRRGVKK